MRRTARRPVTTAELDEFNRLYEQGAPYALIEEEMGISAARAVVLLKARKMRGLAARRSYRTMPGTTAIRLRIGEMHHVDGMGLREIADLTGLTLGQVNYACHVWRSEEARRTVEEEIR